MVTGEGVMGEGVTGEGVLRETMLSGGWGTKPETSGRGRREKHVPRHSCKEQGAKPTTRGSGGRKSQPSS